LKNTLGRVNANADKLVHGRLPGLRSSTTSLWHIDAVGGRPPQQRASVRERNGRSSIPVLLETSFVP
ncbi:MAG TPA: hypothetical protein VII49_03445, partial [Rhizomicrobium sp.]